MSEFTEEFWAGIVGVVVGGVITTAGHLIVHYWQTANVRKRDKKRKEILTKMLNSPGPSGWRKMETMANVVGASRDETARLLIELDARASETGADVWAFIREKPLPNADAD
jgi:hypothetical protein